MPHGSVWSGCHNHNGRSKKNLVILTPNRIFAGLFQRYTRLLVWTALIAIVLNTLSLATPLSFMAVIDRVLVSEGYDTLMVILVILLTITLFEQLLKMVQFRLSQWIGLGMGSESAGVFYRHLFRLKQAYFDTTPVGEILSRSAELDRIRSILVSWILSLAVDLLFMVIFLIVMLSMSLPLSLVVLATVPLHAGQYFVFGSVLSSRESASFEAGVQHQSLVIESLQGIETVRASNRGKLCLHGIFSTLDLRLRKAYRLAQVGMWSARASELIGGVSEVIILYFGARLVLEQELTLGALVAFNMMKDRVTGPLIRLASIWEEVLAFRLSVERLNTVLDSSVEQPDEEAPRSELTSFSKTIKYSGLSFCYPGQDSPVLSNVDFFVARGERVCLLGESGAGKSTLTRLLTLAYDDYIGKIEIDNHEIRSLDLNSVRSQVAYVLQKNTLFSGTIASNILYACESPSDERMRDAARIACVNEFIETLPLGYQTVVQEGGKNFSGGQVQRIALARAIAANTPILILDEATSALDYETEANVVRNLQQLGECKTLIIATHRLSLARICDRIVVLKKGRVAEEGTHQQLIHQEGPYRKLYQYQTGVAGLDIPLRG